MLEYVRMLFNKQTWNSTSRLARPGVLATPSDKGMTSSSTRSWRSTGKLKTHWINPSVPYIHCSSRIWTLFLPWHNLTPPTSTNLSLTSPARTPAWTAAPMATTSSGFTSELCPTSGIRKCAWACSVRFTVQSVLFNAGTINRTIDYNITSRLRRLSSGFRMLLESLDFVARPGQTAFPWRPAHNIPAFFIVFPCFSHSMEPTLEHSVKLLSKTRFDSTLSLQPSHGQALELHKFWLNRQQAWATRWHCQKIMKYLKYSSNTSTILHLNRATRPHPNPCISNRRLLVPSAQDPSIFPAAVHISSRTLLDSAPLQVAVENRCRPRRWTGEKSWELSTLRRLFQLQIGNMSLLHRNGSRSNMEHVHIKPNKHGNARDGVQGRLASRRKHLKALQMSIINRVRVLCFLINFLQRFCLGCTFSIWDCFLSLVFGLAVFAACWFAFVVELTPFILHGICGSVELCNTFRFARFLQSWPVHFA